MGLKVEAGGGRLFNKALYLLNEASQWLPKLGLWRPLVVAALALQMAACKPTAGFENPNPPSPEAVTETSQPPLPTLEPTPTPTPTLTPTPTPTPTPTLEPTPTNTPIPTLSPGQVGGVEGIPDPKETNPELFSLKPFDFDAPIQQFVKAMEMGGIKVNPQEVVDNVQYQPIVGVDGKQYVIGTYYLDPNPNKSGETLEGPIPLMIWDEEGGWRKIHTGNLSEITDAPFGLGGYTESPYYYYQFTPEEREGQIELSRVYVPGDALLASSMMWPGENRYNWSTSDYYVNLMKNKKGKIRGGHLVWDKDFFPDWFITLKDKALKNPDAYRERFIKIISNLIKAYVGRYKDNIHEWLVLNEVAGPNGLDQNNFFVKIIGPELPRIAIEAVRSADPTARIIINDFFVEFPGRPKSEGYYRLIKQLREQGLLNENDIIGFQFHIGALDPHFQNFSSAKELIKKNFRRFINLGVKVAITELDVGDILSNDPQSMIKQAKVYESVVDACFELNLEYGKPVCDSIVVWGLADNSTWLYYTTDNPGHPLLFSRWGEPNPSYYVILKSYLKYLSALNK